MRLGLLGGSFDPFHLGHLWIATCAREQLGLDEVLLVPAAVPPHKTEGTRAPYPLRLEMLRRLQVKRPWLVASDLEADATRPSYTVETLRELRAGLAAGDELWLLLGGDSLHDLPGWRDPEGIVSLARLAVYGRPGHPAEVPGTIEVRWIDGPVCGLSSSWIRGRLARGESIDGMVPEELLEQILSSGVYRRRRGDG